MVAGPRVPQKQQEHGRSSSRQEQENRSSSFAIARALVDAVAGAVAGGASRTITSPLDVIKIRFQVQIEPTSHHLRPAGVQHLPSKYTGILQASRDIIHEEGILGLWRGNVPALLMVMPYTAIQFAVLHELKSFAARSSSIRGDHIQLNSALSFISGAIAGCAATIGSYPFDLLRTVLASQGEPKIFPNLRSAFVGILQSKGITGLYAGLTPTLIEIIPYAGMQFGSYDLFKRWAVMLRQNYSSSYDANEPLSKPEIFFSGLAAGTTAKVFCHPLDVVKKRFQVEGLKRHPRYGASIDESSYKNVWDATRKIIQLEGMTGLYKGLMPSVVKAAPASAITFVVYETVAEWLHAFIS